MARRSTIEILEKELIRRIDSLNNKVFSVKDFRLVYHNLAEEFDFPTVLSYKKFCQYFVTLGHLEEVKLKFPWRTFIRYIWGKAGSHLDLIATLDNTGYYSHYTAVDLHGLTLQNPKKIYFNVEQSPKPQGQGLSQASIDRAFKNNPRSSKQIADYGSFTVHYLMGKNTGNLGVIERDGIRYTDIERTLIDIAVRPIHCGGISEVLRVYQTTKESGVDISANKIRAYLKKLQYVYPYQQSIGYLLDVAGFSSPILALLREDISEFNFYLDYKLRDPVLDPTWKLFIPRDFPRTAG